MGPAGDQGLTRAGVSVKKKNVKKSSVRRENVTNGVKKNDRNNSARTVLFCVTTWGL